MAVEMNISPVICSASDSLYIWLFIFSEPNKSSLARVTYVTHIRNSPLWYLIVKHNDFKEHMFSFTDTTNSDLFEYGEAVSSQHRLLVLNHVALMCEKLGPSILTSTPQVLSFIKSTFQRGCTIINVHDQEVGATFITETVSMALGMLSAILGGAVKV